MAASREMVKRIFNEALNQRKFEVVDEILHPDYVNHTFPAPAKGPAGFRQIITMFDSAFPDMKITVEDTIEEGNKVATWGYWTGTHKGDFQGIPATGKNVKIGYIDTWKIKDGKLHENWVQMDIAGLMQQLGVIPPPKH